MKNPLYEVMRLVVPERCIACGELLTAGFHTLCGRCRWELPGTGFIAQHDNPVYDKLSAFLPLEEASSWLYYDGHSPYQTLIHNLKYRGQWRTAYYMGELLGRELHESGLYGGVDGVVALPIHYRRLLGRGYNQAHYLSQGVAEVLGCELLSGVLRRNTYQTAQARVRSRKERWDRVQGVFSVEHTERLRHKHILLIDDVLTSGATLLSCADALKRGVPECRLSVVTLSVLHYEITRQLEQKVHNRG